MDQSGTAMTAKSFFVVGFVVPVNCVVKVCLDVGVEAGVFVGGPRGRFAVAFVLPADEDERDVGDEEDGENGDCVPGPVGHRVIRSRTSGLMTRSTSIAAA